MLNLIELEDIIDIALDAGAKAMEIYTQEFSVLTKEDASPLTQADLNANAVICERLQKKYPQIPIISEENQQIAFQIRSHWEYYWCIDPIDGTKEFVKKNDEFTVNIALIHQNSPVLGVVYAPALQELYCAKKGEGAFKHLINAQKKSTLVQKLPFIHLNPEDNKLTLTVSRSHLCPQTKEYINQLSLNKTVTVISKGSSLKLCMVASGEATVYPRFSPTMEWDTAAGDAIVKEAGKMCYIYEAQLHRPLTYNKKELQNPSFVVM